MDLSAIFGMDSRKLVRLDLRVPCGCFALFVGTIACRDHKPNQSLFLRASSVADVRYIGSSVVVSSAPSVFQRERAGAPADAKCVSPVNRAAGQSFWSTGGRIDAWDGFISFGEFLSL